MIFSLGGIVFDADNNGHDANGVSWGLDVLEGWWDTPDVRQEVMDLPLRDGARVSDAYRSARVVSLRGGIKHGDKVVMAAAVRQLTAALDLLTVDGTFVAFETPLAKQLAVRRAAPVDITWVGTAVTWETTLVAGDWRKYGLDEQIILVGPYTAPASGVDLTLDSTPHFGIESETGSGADAGLDFTGAVGVSADEEAVNEGTAYAYPVIEFRGPTSSSMTSFKLTNIATGDVLQIDATVNAGDTIIADMGMAYGLRSGSPVTLSGASRYGSWVTPRTPWALPPGTNVLRFEVLTGTSTGALARVTYRSAWE